MIMKLPERLDNKELIKVIKSQIRLCLLYKNFHSIIFVSFLTKKKIVLEHISYLCEANWIVKRNIMTIKNSRNETVVCFKNGSYIRVARGGECSKGYRAHNIVIDSDITEREIINDIIRPHFIDLLILPPKFVIKFFKVERFYRKQFKKREYWVKI